MFGEETFVHTREETSSTRGVSHLYAGHAFKRQGCLLTCSPYLGLHTTTPTTLAEILSPRASGRNPQVKVNIGDGNQCRNKVDQPRSRGTRFRNHMV